MSAPRLAVLFAIAGACGAQEAPPQDPAPHGAVRKAPPAPEVIAELPPDGGPDWNRLVFEMSPYLLQHAGNPVDWWPWGDAAFEEAERRGVPVFLSIGYSTCHWCHVMEHESFEDEEVAALLNEHFVCIKVDREERPDVDQVYMSITIAMNEGNGGWPMTVVMTPERIPFFAGTYFPKTGRGGRPGVMELVPWLVNRWENEPDIVAATTTSVVDYAAQQAAGAAGEAPGEAELLLGLAQFSQRYDRVNGGFGSAPKFPVPHNLRFLLRMYQRTGDEQALEMVEHTLERMRLGGVYDHVGYGFHRYSTDPRWFLPHFEKMLYDQAQLAVAYLEAYQVTENEHYADVAREIFTYVLRDMTSPEGGFYSAEDADSEGEEGLFYTWTPGEVIAVLGAVEGELFNQVYGLVQGGNFVDQGSRARTGRSIPFLTKSLEEVAADLGHEPAALATRMEAARAALFEVREARIHPLKDDKVLTDWNGLMIAAFARGARALDEPAYEVAAVRAAEFALAHLTGEDGRLLKRWRGGEAAFPAVLDDYAYLIGGLLELYHTTFDASWLGWASALADLMVADFADEERGGFFLSADGGEQLFVRPKEIYDGATPSGNSAAAFALFRLGRILARPDLEAHADATLRAFGAGLRRGPSQHTVSMLATDFAVGPSFEVVIVGERGEEDTEAMLVALQRELFPRVVAVFRPAGEEEPEIARLAPYTASQTAVDDAATAYVCRDYACRAPTTDLAEVLGVLRAAPGDGVEEEPLPGPDGPSGEEESGGPAGEPDGPGRRP